MISGSGFIAIGKSCVFCICFWLASLARHNFRTVVPTGLPFGMKVAMGTPILLFKFELLPVQTRRVIDVWSWCRSFRFLSILMTSLWAVGKSNPLPVFSFRKWVITHVFLVEVFFRSGERSKVANNFCSHLGGITQVSTVPPHFQWADYWFVLGHSQFWSLIVWEGLSFSVMWTNIMHIHMFASWPTI